MAKCYSKDRSKRSQLLYNFDSAIFSMVCGNIGDPMCLKDLDGKFIYANDAYLRFIGVSAGTQIEGKLEDSIIPDNIFSPGADFSYDDHTFNSTYGKKVSIVRESARTKLGGYDFYLFDKAPVFIEGVLSAYLVTGRKNFIFSLSDFYNKKVPSEVKTTLPNDLFTDREWDVIFFLQQNLNRDQIAGLLDMSPVTVKNHINHIYKKSGAKNSNELIEFCSKCDLLNFISIKNKISRKMARDL